MPEISVILPIYNGAHLLPAVLDGFKRQTLPHWQFEIVVVDDGSTDDTPQILEAARQGLPLRVFQQRHVGVPAARNVGLFASLGAIQLFADQDKVASPEFLLAHLVAHRGHPEPHCAVLGHTGLAKELEKNPVMRHVSQAGSRASSNDGLKQGQVIDGTVFRGGTSCKRHFLLNHGIFNAALAFGSEDVEFGFRSNAFGLQVIYEPAAEYTIIKSVGFRELCELQQQIGQVERAFAELSGAAEVRHHCKVDEALLLWSERSGCFSPYMRWVERLDRMAQARADAGFKLRSDDQMILDDAYRAAFALCRAKGVAMFEGGNPSI